MLSFIIDYIAKRKHPDISQTEIANKMSEAIRLMEIKLAKALTRGNILIKQGRFRI